MPKTRDIELNYQPDNPDVPFGPNHARLAVAPGDTIRFTIGKATRAHFAGCKLKISIHHPKHFSAAVLEHSDGQTGDEALEVRVVARTPAELASVAAGPNRVITGYKCELLDGKTKKPRFSVDGASGGDIVPDSDGN